MWIAYRFGIAAIAMFAIVALFFFQYRLATALARREARAGSRQGAPSEASPGVETSCPDIALR